MSSNLGEESDQISDFLKHVVVENNNISDNDSYDSQSANNGGATHGNKSKSRYQSMTPIMKSQSPMLTQMPLSSLFANNNPNAGGADGTESTLSRNQTIDGGDQTAVSIEYSVITKIKEDPIAVEENKL